ncbi:hypothetical protein Tco_1104623 [Tanacetum coccineum]
MLERSTGIAGVTKATSGPEAITKSSSLLRKAKGDALISKGPAATLTTDVRCANGTDVWFTTNTWSMETTLTPRTKSDSCQRLMRCL